MTIPVNDGLDRESNTYDAGFMQMDFKTGNMPLCFRM